MEYSQQRIQEGAQDARAQPFFLFFGNPGQNFVIMPRALTWIT